MWIRLLPTLLLLQCIAAHPQLPSLTETALSPRGFWDWFFGSKWIALKGYNRDGCQTEPDVDTSIDASCRIISSTGITNVVVVPNDKLPPTCILTLYEDKDCKGDSYAQIGPITPTDLLPSACIGPIRNPAGGLFGAKSASMKC